MEHDVLAFFDLQHALDPLQEAVDQRELVVIQLRGRADQCGSTLEYRCDFVEVVRLHRGAARNQIANDIRLSEAGCNLDCARKLNDTCFDPFSIQIVVDYRRIRRCDPRT